MTHQLFREGLANILDAQPDFEVVGEADDGLEVFVKARDLNPDLILMDVGMPGCDGVEACEHIKAAMPHITIVMLTVQDEDEKLFEARRTAPRATCSRASAPGTSWRCSAGLCEVRRPLPPPWEAACSPSSAGWPASRPCRRRRERGPDGPRAGRAQPRRRGRHGSGDCRQPEHQHPHGQDAHGNILAKLQLSKRHEAAQYALREGLIPPRGHPANGLHRGA